MGWFSGSTKIYVSSVVYNLAGDIALRPNYLKTSVIGAVISDVPSIPDSLRNSYLQGPGMRLKSFARWARIHGFDSDIGLTTGSITSGHSIDQNVLASQIPYDTTLHSGVHVQSAVIGDSDYTFWADQWAALHHPDRLQAGYSTSIDNSNDNDTPAITITWPDNTTDTLIPSDFSAFGSFLYATYVLTSGATAGSITPGAVVTLASSGAFPSISGWTLDYSNVTPHTVTLNKTTTVDTTYSDSTPPTSTTTPSSSTADYNETHAKYEKTVNAASGGAAGIFQTRSFLFLDQVGAVTAGTKTTVTTTSSTTEGVTKTVKTTVVEDELILTRSYHTDTQPITVKSWTTPLVFIYQRGSGNATLDAMWATPTTAGSFFPFIPFRIDNQPVPTLYPTTIYPESKKAIKKALNAKYDDILAKINTNSSIGDIDYAYAVFGCCLNTKENASKKYIYKFFQAILNDPSQSTSSDYTSYEAAYLAAKNSWETWLTWFYNFQAGTTAGSNEPTKLPFPTMPLNSINVSSNSNAVMDYNITISWNYMFEETGSGLWSADAKPGALTIASSSVASYNEPTFIQDLDTGQFILYDTGTTYTDAVAITWQETATHWRRLNIVGLKHRNLIYKGNAVEITAKDALADVNESGFIIPLHEDIYKSLSIVDYTQMSTACCYIVFNCYTVVKTPWYATGWFQILLIVGIVVVSVLTLGVGTVGATAGLLGTNAGVGGALGLAGVSAMLAVIVGAVANSLAAMILLILLTKGATAAFGDKLGGLISSILAIVATVTMQISAGLKSGQSLSSIFKDLTSATKLIDLTSSAGNTFAAYVKADTQDILGQITSYQKELTGQIKSVEDQAAALFGYDKGMIDPTIFTEFTDAGSSNFTPESLTTFLDRTLMTGSDIAELSMSMISDFANLTLNTDLASSA